MLSKARKDYRTSPLYLALLAAKAALRDETARLKEGCNPAKTRRSKPGKAQREVMVQRKEARQSQLPLKPEPEDVAGTDPSLDELDSD
ncbi:hypothetical protein OKW38_000395 [Paraburkholderia sp. MM5496-R1]|uniref:hypothetical protein n=1 Tax=unclassified Paraburkholderia TaxID=2615204 RepID=UPI003D1BEEFF